jgi:hypothetical protein
MKPGYSWAAACRAASGSKSCFFAAGGIYLDVTVASCFCIFGLVPSPQRMVQTLT